MEHQAEVADFLRMCRNRITPERAGIIGGGHRRVPGLRREEVALLTGISVEYYARMERGNLRGVSLEVLDSLAHALQLDEAEADHLADLAKGAGPAPSHPRRSTPTGHTAMLQLQRFLNAVTGTPMWVRDRRLNFVAANPLGRTLYAPMLDDPVNQGNMARFTFLNPASQKFFPDWEENAEDMAATLRSYAGQDPLDGRLTDLIGELATRSDAFRHRWSRHHVRHHHAGIKRIHHPVVGDLELPYQAMELPMNRDWFMFAFTSEPGSPTEERLQLLSSVAANDDAPRRSPDPLQ